MTKLMIRLILSGGLGNQMFQYAAGRALSIRTNTDLSINNQILKKKTKATQRNYELNIFRIKPNIENRVSEKIALNLFLFLQKINSNILINRYIFRDKKAQCYDENFSALPNNKILYGYFQNQNYFKEIAETIQNDFSFIKPLKEKNLETRNLITNCNSISLHIRRGDYLNKNSNLRVLNIDYYRRAIDYFISKIKDPHFFIFSDDIDWVNKNLKLNLYEHTIVNWNKGKDSYIDMQLMSLCKHNIIANSSFSWWGAWLNKNSHKIVIAPDSWYKTDQTNDYPDGFVPSEWIILQQSV